MCKFYPGVLPVVTESVIARQQQVSLLPGLTARHTSESADKSDLLAKAVDTPIFRSELQTLAPAPCSLSLFITQPSAEDYNQAI